MISFIALSRALIIENYPSMHSQVNVNKQVKSEALSSYTIEEPLHPKHFHT